MKDLLLWPFDVLYQRVVGSLECTYCIFYRGVAVGLVVGVSVCGVLGLTARIFG